MIKLKPGFHMIATIAVMAAIAEKKKKKKRQKKKRTSAIAATTIADILKVISQRSLSLRSLESGFHMIADIFFLSDRRDHMETGLNHRHNHPPFLLNCFLYALQTYRTCSSKLRLLLVYIYFSFGFQLLLSSTHDHDPR